MTRRKDPAATRTPIAEMEAAGHALPQFEPVPRKYRHDGWTPERQKAFIAALADTGSVKRAAFHVNMSPEGAYWLRRQPGSETFRRAWEAALDFGVQRMKDEAFDRALNGQLVPVFVGGKLKGFRRVKNDRLLMFCLRMNARGADKLLGSKFTVGADAAVAAGPLGRQASAQTDATMHAEMLAWSRSRGVFAGVSLQGSTLRSDGGENKELYGKELSARDIVRGSIATPAAAREFMNTLAKY